MVYNAGQAFEPLNKRTDWNWFCHGQSVERDTECSFGKRNLLHKKSLNKQWGAEQVPAISKATPHWNMREVRCNMRSTTFRVNRQLHLCLHWMSVGSCATSSHSIAFIGPINIVNYELISSSLQFLNHCSLMLVGPYHHRIIDIIAVIVLSHEHFNFGVVKSWATMSIDHSALRPDTRQKHAYHKLTTTVCNIVVPVFYQRPSRIVHDHDC